MKKVKISMGAVRAAVYGFLWLDVLVFVIGFVKPWLSVPASAALAVMMLFICKSERKKSDCIEIGITPLILSALAVLAYMLLCGQMGYSQQAADWQGRNTIMHELINSHWPVRYSDGSAFTYYLGLFMVPAAFGKAFGITAGYVMLWLWTSLGVFLTYLLLIKASGADRTAKYAVVLLALFVFSDAENIGYIAGKLLQGVVRIFKADYSYKTVVYGFTSNYHSFSWVFNQMIPGFMAAALYMSEEKRDRASIFALGAALLLHSPFPLAAFFIIAAADFIADIIKTGFKKPVMECLSVQNIIAIAVFIPMIALYVGGNAFAPKPDSMKFTTESYGGKLEGYIVFVIAEFILYSLCVFKEHRKDVTFWTVNAVLLLLPFFKIGLYNDLRTRSSALCMLVLMIYLLRLWFSKNSDRSVKLRRYIAAALVIFAALPTLGELNTAARSLADNASDGLNMSLPMWADTFEGIGRKYSDDDILNNYFTFDADNDPFYKYIAKK